MWKSKFTLKRFQIEVVLLEETEKYLHVMVAVDDGTLPASIRPVTDTFLRYKDTAGTEG